jgi:MerR family copper efflux transcriptional regulator
MSGTHPTPDPVPTPASPAADSTPADPGAEPTPVACTLGAGDLADRVARWKAVAARADGERSATEHGIRLSFTAAPGVADELRDLAALESDCCSFATWTVHEDSGQVTVDITGETPTGATAIQDMFATLGGPQ